MSKMLFFVAINLNPEAYRQKFRNCQRDISQTFVEFARVKEQLFDRWCHSKKVNKDFEKLRQLILIEEFKRRIPFHMKTFIDEKQVETYNKLLIWQTSIS